METLPPDVVCAREATAHVLSAEEAESCPIHDVVMPLPGFDVIYPTHPGKKCDLFIFIFYFLFVCMLHEK